MSDASLRQVALTSLEAAREAREPISLFCVGDHGLTIRRRPSEAHRAAKRLHEDDSDFASGVVPFLAEADEYVERLGTDPFYATVRTELQRGHETDVVVFLTDDGRRTGIYEAVGAAREGNNRVVVFLLPSVLFEPGGLADLDTAYER
ncbi:MAG: hypothetical protein V5A62_08290 [Haloarculaceae archaeon]